MTLEKTLTILLADDDPRSLRILESTLGLLDEKPRLLTAEDGEQAISLIDREPLDLVITDLHMPGADGLEVLAHVINQRPGTPVIVVTGQATPRLQDKLRNTGSCQLLEKPLTPNRVLEAVRGLTAPPSRGHLEGFTLASILQLVEMEGKSCEVTVTGRTRAGTLVFARGRLVHAAIGEETGDEAVLTILDIQEPQVKIGGDPGRQTVTVDSDLAHLILESARLDDHASRELFEASESLGREDSEDVAAATAKHHRQLFDELARMQGFRSAALIDLSSRQVLFEVGSSDAEAEGPETSPAAVCRLVEADRQLAGDSTGSAEIIIRQQQQWHVLRRLPGQLAVHLIFAPRSNPALVQYRLTLWLSSCLQGLAAKQTPETSRRPAAP